MSPTQRLVLEHLKRRGAATAKQIAKSLLVTPMAVRHHLAVLDKSGLVSTTLERGRAGRPTYLYSPTEDAESYFPNEYAAFATRLLQAVVDLDGEAKLEFIFSRIKKAELNRHRSRMVGKNLGEKVAEMVNIQNESGYMAEWHEVGNNNFEIIERNCAIWQVARICNQTCECETSVMESLLGTPVHRRETITDGGLTCAFVISGNSAISSEEVGGNGSPRSKAGE